MNEEKIEFYKKKIQIYFDNKINVHISLKNGTFYNGFISKQPSADFFFIEDRKEGKKLVFFIELKLEPKEYTLPNKEVKE